MALYPPVVASSMPAFDKNQTSIRIYFSLSDYNSNSMDDVERVHVSVRFQNSNVNALSDSAALIIALPWFYDLTLDKYYVIINQSHFNQEKCIEEKAFIPDKLYKVQLRFASVYPKDGEEYSSNWFTNNIDKFSLWSTVCIIKPITPPLFYIEDFDREGKGKPSEEEDENNFFSNFADFLITYKQLKSSEILNSWRMRLLTEDFTEDLITNITSYTLADTGQKLVNATNYNLNSNNLIIEGSIPYLLEDNKNYKLYLLIFTKNDYSKGLLYKFTCFPQVSNAIIGGKLKTYVNEELGYIKLDFSSSENSKLTNIVIRRTDSKSGFTIWEDLKNFTSSGLINFTYFDFTAESGILYRYLVQKRDSRGRRGLPVYDSSQDAHTGVMALWLNAFLLLATANGDGGKIQEVSQLKLKYDFQISSYKTNVSESKTDTIGSKYPFIRRNGNMYYRSFPITGTITAYMDEARLFSSENKIYNNQTSIYDQYRGLLGLYTTIYDYTKERLFREKVEAFLYNSKPKLYKSMQEGNIFIKLMEASLTPKNELGRLVYSFSATAYEIDEANILTYNKYKLINVGQYNPYLTDSKTIMSQLSSYSFEESQPMKVFPAGQDIIGTNSSSTSNNIAKKIKYGESFNDQIVSDFQLNWLRITVESEPYLIGEFIENGLVVYRPIDDIKDDKNSEDGKRITQGIDYPLYQLESTYHIKSKDDETKILPQNIYLGTLFEINGEPIIISPPNNIYELKEDNFVFNKNISIIPAKDTMMNIDYRVDTKVKLDTSKIPKNKEFEKINGQLSGTFQPNEQLIYKLKNKYKYSYKDSTTTADTTKVQKYVNAVHSILVDSLPGTVVKLKTSSNINLYRFVLNLTGELKFLLPTSLISITSLKLVGKNYIYDNKDMIKKDNNQPLSRSEIQHPYNGQICQEGDKYYYFNNNVWLPCTVIADNIGVEGEVNKVFSIDVECPVKALVFYYLTVGRDYY